MASTISRLKNTDSLGQWSDKVNSLIGSVEGFISSGGSFSSASPSSSDLIVYDSGWKNKTIIGEVVIDTSYSNATQFKYKVDPTVISNRTAITSVDSSNDYLLIWDATDSALKKVKPQYIGGTPGGSADQVQFNLGGTTFMGATGFTFDGTRLNVPTLSVDTNTIYVDEVNNRVGIGNSSPSYPLHVTGNINTSTSYLIAGTAVLTSSSLGSGITSSSLTSLGTISALNAGTGTFSGAISGLSLTVSNAVSAASSAISGNSTVGGNLTVTGTLGVTAAARFSSTFNTGNSAAGFGGNVGVGGTLGATGAVTFGSTLNVTGTSTLTNIGATGVIAFRHVFTNGGLNVGATGAGVGEIRATGDITAYYSSDAKFKDNVVEIPNALEKIKSIRGVTFDWNEEYIKSHGGEDGYFVRKRDVGVIAQEIQKVLPELVVERSEGYLAVKYDRIVALLIQAVKELSDKLEEGK